MKTYLCFEIDVKVHHEKDGCKLFHKGKGLIISSSGDWLALLLKLLLRPIPENDLNDILSKESLINAKKLVTFLEEQGIIIRFLAENDSSSLFYINNKRSYTGGFSMLDRNCGPTYQLEPPLVDDISLLTALRNRYSCSETTTVELSMQKLSTLLALTYGYFPSEEGIMRRAVPAAGGLFPLSIFLSLPRGDELDCYCYVPEHSHIDRISTCHGRIRDLCNDQNVTDPARALVMYVYNVKKNTIKYGPRGLQFALIECGHAAQNLIIGAAGMGIGSRCIGAISFQTAQDAFNLTVDQIPMYAVALY